MVKRIIDVLTDEEQELTAQVNAVRKSLARVTAAFAKSATEHEQVCKTIIRDKEARDVLAQELHDMGERIVTHKSRTDPVLAKEAYKTLKPDRYDVEVIQVPNHLHNGSLTYYVKMWWGNVSKIIYEGRDNGLARHIAHKITDLTGCDNFVHREVDSKKDIWK